MVVPSLLFQEMTSRRPNFRSPVWLVMDVRATGENEAVGVV